ncbi:hypothetical protein [Duganella radicis]|uniref:DUF1640 domain-containing protein n=1 Tax=Duganella radicis TaxID=551988 RepID=A0A6L6PG09_9BURK|nr:hypothetical protein [Duganella radicis]MTV37954.1 hypothetical protein [Duganella radicis]
MSMKFDDERPETYHWRVHTEKRIERLETDNMSHEVDIAFLKAHYATKDDIAELKAAIAALEARIDTKIAEAKTTIIIWVVGAVFLGQLLPALLKLLIPG